MTCVKVISVDVYRTLPVVIQKMVRVLEEDGQVKIEYTSPDSKSTNV